MLRWVNGIVVVGEGGQRASCVVFLYTTVLTAKTQDLRLPGASSPIPINACLTLLIGCLYGINIVVIKPSGCHQRSVMPFE